jgi:tetraprenyl-beta-curcumene synthase
LAAAFVRAACCYWLALFPCIQGEVKHWQRRARAIPDPALRTHALASHEAKWGNIEGAGAFAILAPRGRRPEVVRALVAIQAAYDYADTLAEQASSNRQANGYRLHLALLAALEPTAQHPDYYARHPQREDNGYMTAIVEACRTALCTLPGHPLVSEPARRAAARIATYQSLNHSGHAGQEALKRWARTQTPPDTELGWWETAAAAASSLALLALVAAAAQPTLTSEEARAIERAYFPWIGALHTLLDSLIDYREDTDSGQPSLISPYGSPRATAAGLQTLARRSVQHAQTLPSGSMHLLILAAMTSLYLCSPEGSLPHAQPATHAVLNTLGHLTRPTMLISSIRRRVHHHSRAVKGLGSGNATSDHAI